MDYKVRPWKMAFFNDQIPGPTSMVRYFKKNNIESLWAFNRCKPNVDQEEWPCTKKWMCWFFCNICPTKAILKNQIKSNQSWPFSCLHFSPLLKNIIKKSLHHHFSAIGPYLILPNHLFCLSHHKTHWAMSVNSVGLKICLLGTSNPMVTLTFFSWCKPRFERLLNSTS